jgi:hypothetical protein
MPAKSQQQMKFIFFLRNKYKNKKDAPDKYKWAFDPEWTEDIKMKKLPVKTEKVSENIIQRFSEFVKNNK